MGAVVTNQNAFRFRRDDGSETTATWMQATNINGRVWDWPSVMEFGTAFRIRFVVQETGGGMQTGIGYELRYSRNGGTYTVVSASSNVVQATTGGGNLTDGNDTTQQIGSGTFVSANGGQSTDGNTGTSSIASSEIEVEFCIQLIEADCLFGDQITLRVYEIGGTALDTYTQTPTIVVPVIQTLGEGNNHDTNVNLSSSSGSGPDYTITVGTDETANMVPGDAFWDEDSTASKKYLIYRVLSSTTATVIDSEAHGSAPATGTNQAKIERYYNSSTPWLDWETDLDDTNIHSSGGHAIAHPYNDAAFTETSLLVGCGSTIPLRGVAVMPPSGERHDGTAGTGARLVPASGTADAFAILARQDIDFHIDFFEVDASNGPRCALDLGSGSTIGGSQLFRVLNCIVHDVDSVQQAQGIYCNISGSGGQKQVLNCFVYDIHDTHTEAPYATGIQDSGGSGHLDCFNSSVYLVKNDNGTGQSYGISAAIAQSSTSTVTNCIAMDCATGSTSGTEEDFDSGIDTQSYNLSSDTSATGTGSLTSKTSGNQFVSTVAGSEDLHLTSGSDAEDAGTNLGVSPWGVQYDIDNEARSAPWDIGADKYTPAAAGGPNLLTLLGVG